MAEGVEVIVVDDGSTKPITTDYPWCTVIRKKNGGSGSARNKGLSASKGEYIAFIDADDLVADYYIDKILEEIKRLREEALKSEEEVEELIKPFMGEDDSIFGRMSTLRVVDFFCRKKLAEMALAREDLDYVSKVAWKRELEIVNDKLVGSTPTEKTKKSNKQLAEEVIRGDWGNGEERKKRLTEAGYNFSEIQIIVNNKLGVKSSSSNKKSNDEVAYEVIRGDWGNGEERKYKLTQAGYDYDTIQKIVNDKLK